ncbi:ABC transporter permease [Actinomadura sp. ATCC 31491]|uniref:Transport permease protein n=1 Tax=Actinomadura luzonensis TaxID=2805427 RepID=A0ABT0GAD1_9ACTN|nr:ABC transporter permease [Actinomadura luzonensis]MCK2221555.1 ABC transporter permease [Actinomadura luzonensis]
MTTAAQAPSRRRSPLAVMVWTEVKLLLREPPAIAFPLLMPLALLLVLGLSIPDMSRPSPVLGGQSYLDSQLPATMTLMSAAITAFTVLPISVAGYRDSGVLRRMSTTPVPPRRLLAVQLTIYLALVFAATAIMVACGALVLGIAVPRQLAGFVLVLLLGTASLMALGLLVAVLSPSAKSAPGLGTLLMFPLLFLGGVWVPRESLPAPVRVIGDLTPAGSFGRALRDTWYGAAPSLAAVVVMAVWLVAVGLLAVRLFRWE